MRLHLKSIFYKKGFVLILTVLLACSYNKSEKSESLNQKIDSTTSVQDSASIIDFVPKKLSVLVLPPYDEIANAGISPPIMDYLEQEISKDSSVNLIKFPYKRLMNVPYYNVFDKKYCKPILDRIKVDIIIMSKLEIDERTGNTSSDRWAFGIRIYDVATDSQKNSAIKGKNLSDTKILNLIQLKRRTLIKEINIHNQ